MSQLEKLGPLFQNQIEKRQTFYKMQLHRQRLNDSLNVTKREYFNPNNYRHPLADNAKKTYMEEVKDSEIQRENRILYSKIHKINDNKKRYSSNSIKKHDGSLNAYNRRIQN